MKRKRVTKSNTPKKSDKKTKNESIVEDQDTDEDEFKVEAIVSIRQNKHKKNMKPISNGKDMKRSKIPGKVWMDCTKTGILKAKMPIHFLRKIRLMYPIVKTLISLRRHKKRGKKRRKMYKSTRRKMMTRIRANEKS